MGFRELKPKYKILTSLERYEIGCFILDKHPRMSLYTLSKNIAQGYGCSWRTVYRIADEARMEAL